MSDAKRFGGAHSPGGARKPGAARNAASTAPASPFSGRKTRSFSWRVFGLYLMPTPLILSGLWQILTFDLPDVLWTFGPWAILIFAAWLTGEGLRAEAAFDERVIAKPPAFPRKLFGAALTGAGVFAAAAFAGDQGVIIGGVFGALAATAHVAAFGADPMRAKGVDGIADAELERVAAKIDEAESIVAETVKAAEALGDRRLERRIDGLAYAARDILKEIQSDPRDMRRSRQFLSVHLVGLRDATVKLASAAAKGAGGEQRGEYEALLSDLEQSFSKTRDNLLIDDQTALEVEIEVLRGRLKQEGAL